ncbi:SPX-domain-containing protein [Clavulina sp. PMI_390]|nr:SPX-domain-containing protein [Clavulina sp. PMI_390]
MKFSNSLKFNSVAEWQKEYIDYDNLKRHIYELESSIDAANGSSRSHERTALLGRMTPAAANEKFLPLLDRELRKVVAFYVAQEKELLAEVERLGQSIARREEEGLNGLADSRYSDDDSDDDDESHGIPSGSRVASQSRRKRSLSGGSPVKGRRRMSMDFAPFPHNNDLEAGPEPLSPIASSGSHPEDLVGSKTSVHSRPTLSKIITQPRAALADIFSPTATTNAAPETVWTSKSTAAFDIRMLFKRRISNLYTEATNSKSFVELNHSGFRKILKKYDKQTENDLKDKYLHETVETSYPFDHDAKTRLNDVLNTLVTYYASCVTGGDISLAAEQLKSYQREQIVWERDTVWRQMIGQERRGEVDGHVKSLTATGGRTRTGSRSLFILRTPLGPVAIKLQLVSLLCALGAFALILNVPFVDGEQQNRCFAILVFATIMWATEAIPLFVTSISIPLLVTLLKVTRKQPSGEPMTAEETTKYIFSVMFSPTIMLLLGGFTLSSALSKTNIDRIIMTQILSWAGSRPSTVILSFMGVAWFASMWISNVAAPAMCFALIRMAIALAANIGGQASPISSPQNLIALEQMNPQLDWFHWFAVAWPVSIVSITLIWLLLLALYRPSVQPNGEPLVIKGIRASRDTFSWKHWYVLIVCVVTIGLWCIAHSIESVFGDMGIIAIIPILAFFGTGVLSKADFDQFLWSIVFLAMGGIALGKAVVTSGLLHAMDASIKSAVSGLSLYGIVLVLSGVVLVVSTFISHTIASVLLVPIALEVGQNLGEPHPNLLIFITGLVCSAGMGMPVSGFPNQTAATQEDEMGELYLTNIDFLKAGVPASIIATLVVIFFGCLGLINAYLDFTIKHILTKGLHEVDESRDQNRVVNEVS